MSKKPVLNKALQPEANKKVKTGGRMATIRLLPGRGVGGIGGPGTVATLPVHEADLWVSTGYAEYVEEQPAPVPSDAADPELTVVEPDDEDLTEEA